MAAESGDSPQRGDGLANAGTTGPAYQMMAAAVDIFMGVVP
jgi:hypothetical protein